MGGIFDLDGSLMRALNGFADMVVMSLWWLLGCLPVVTIGASTTALYYVAMKSVRHEGTVTGNFWKSYRENLKQAVVVEGILVVLGVLLYMMYRLAFGMDGGLSGIAQLGFQVLFFLYLIMLSFVFPVLSRFVLTVPQLFRNVLIMCIGDVPRTVGIVVIHLLPLLLIFLRIDWFFTALPMLAALIPGIVATLNAGMFLKIFQKYIPEEILEQEEEANQNLGMFETEES